MNREIWIFGSDKRIDMTNVGLKKKIANFKSSWNTHGAQIHPDLEIIDERFFKISSNLDGRKVSGCAKDELMRFVKSIELEIDVVLLDRTLIFYKNEAGEVFSVSFKEIETEEFNINRQSIYDLSILSEEDFKQRWILPFEQSWLAKMPRKITH